MEVRRVSWRFCSRNFLLLLDSVVTHSMPSALQLWQGIPDLTKSHLTLRVLQCEHACDALFLTGRSEFGVGEVDNAFAPIRGN